MRLITFLCLSGSIDCFRTNYAIRLLKRKSQCVTTVCTLVWYYMRFYISFFSSTTT